MSQAYGKDSDTKVLGLSCPGPLLSFCLCVPSGTLSGQPLIGLSTPLCGTVSSAPPAGVANPYLAFIMKLALSVEFYSFCLNGLSSWVAVSGRGEGGHFSYWSISTMNPAWGYKIQLSSFI